MCLPSCPRSPRAARRRCEPRSAWRRQRARVWLLRSPRSAPAIKRDRADTAAVIRIVRAISRRTPNADEGHLRLRRRPTEQARCAIKAPRVADGVRRLAGAWRGPIGKPGRIYPRSPPDQPSDWPATKDCGALIPNLSTTSLPLPAPATYLVAVIIERTGRQREYHGRRLGQRHDRRRSSSPFIRAPPFTGYFVLRPGCAA